VISVSKRTTAISAEREIEVSRPESREIRAEFREEEKEDRSSETCSMPEARRPELEGESWRKERGKEDERVKRDRKNIYILESGLEVGLMNG
jgi:hypothetical protein